MHALGFAWSAPTLSLTALYPLLQLFGMSRALLLAALCFATVYAVASMPLSKSGSLRSLGALNHRLTREQLTTGKAQEQWLLQKLDHHDLSNTSTFRQRYFVNDSFVDVSNARVFVMIGGEGPVGPAYVDGYFHLNELARKHKALIVTLEHRF